MRDDGQRGLGICGGAIESLMFNVCKADIYCNLFNAVLEEQKYERGNGDAQVSRTRSG